MILLKIDVTKLDKNRFFKGQNGAVYLDAALIETPTSKYGDSHMIVQSVSKEERLAGVKGAIIGNAKTIGQQNGQQTNQSSNRPARRPAAPPASHKTPVDSGLEWNGDEDSIPF